MTLSELPEGVRVVKTYKGTGLTLLECTHKGSMSAIRVDPECCGEQERHGGCCGNPVPVPFWMCRICKGDENTTGTFSRPVKMLARVDPEALKARQAVLF